MTEVFVVDRAALFGGEWPQGFAPIDPGDAGGFLARASGLGRFEPRAEAERTPAWKQWIPYCVLRCVDGGGRPTGVFRVRRTTGQTESRLHGLWSIGLGGHVEPVDRDPGPAEAIGHESFFCNALRRELDEELELPRAVAELQPRFVGLLNDDATPVGAVHAGLVYVLDLELGLTAAIRAVGVREISKMRGGFGSLVELAKLWQTPSQFESWSQFLIRAGVAGPMGSTVDTVRVDTDAGPDPI